MDVKAGSDLGQGLLTHKKTIIMKQKLFVLFAVAAMLAAGCCKPAGVIKTPVPARPAGQQDVIGLTAEPIETVHIGVVGLGMRGSEALRRLAQLPGAEITALCDLLPDRVESGQALITSLGAPAATGTYSGTQESWRGCHFLPQGIFLNQGSNLYL